MPTEMIADAQPNLGNAGRQFLQELIEALTMLRRERATRCLLLRSSVPNVFCAGADLKVCGLAQDGQIVHQRIVVNFILPCSGRVNSLTPSGKMQERAGMTQQETSEFVSELRQAFSSIQA